MFLDDTHIWPRDERPTPPPPPSRRERILPRVLLFYGLILLLAPISLGAAVDLIRWFIQLLG